MDETTFDWDDLRLFLAVARAGGLGPAALATGKSPPTLGRRMLALERRLGLELFRRLPRGYALTDQGRRLLEDVTLLESRIAPLADTDATRRPVVKISAGQWVTDLLCRRAASLIGGDRVALRFIAADHVLDISRREAVIGIRNRRPDQPGLAGRRIGQVQFAIYAVAPAVTLWARVIGSTPSARWLAETHGTAPAIEVTNPRNALDLALAGVARAVLPTFVGTTRSGLMQIGPPIAALTHDQWLVTHDEERHHSQVRRVIDRVHATLRAEIGPGETPEPIGQNNSPRPEA